MYKKGDLIGHDTMDGLFLCEVIDIYNINNKDLCDICLTVKVLYDGNLNKPFFNKPRSIVLPQQRYEIRTKEEYFEEMQHEIDKKQNILNELKEKYNV